jgi:hypothetical protein
MRFCLAFLLTLLIISCKASERPIGMTLSFQSAGRPVVVQRFDPDGRRGPVPGSLGGMSPWGGKQMIFMPGDSKQAIPKFIDVEWTVPSIAYENWSSSNADKTNEERYSESYRKEYERQWAANPHYTKRIDVTHILTPELISKVRADSRHTQLALTITFNNSEVDIQAHADKWR